MSARLPITRRDVDGTIIDGTAALSATPSGGFMLHDFRDLDGRELCLPSGSEFRCLLDDDLLDVLEEE